MNSRMILLIVVVLALVSLVVVSAGGSNDWEFVVDAEARNSEGAVLATRQARASVCEPDGEGACTIAWDWEGETFPSDTHEWVKSYGLSYGVTIPVVYVPYWCDVDLELCRSKAVCDGEAVVVEPSEECLVALRDECSLEPDERGFWYGRTLGGSPDEGSYAFYEPIDLLAEWYDECPLPPATGTPAPAQPTYTPQPTHPPDPTPTCRPTWTPVPTDTPYPTSTPWPTNTPYPAQPPF